MGPGERGKGLSARGERLRARGMSWAGGKGQEIRGWGLGDRGKGLSTRGEKLGAREKGLGSIVSATL